MSEAFTQDAPAPDHSGLPDAPTDEQLAGTPAPEPQDGENAAEPPEGPKSAEPPKQKFVPHEALHETRQQLKAEREARERVERRFEEFQRFTMDKLTPPQPKAPEPPLPDVNHDPVAYFKAQNEALRRELAEIKQPIQAQEQNSRFVATVKQQIAQFSQSAPDYADAYQHAVKAMREDAEAWGIDPGLAETQFAQQALQSGRNVAEAVYNYAKRKGYTGPAPAAPAAPPAPPPPDMGAVQRGQAAARTAGNGGQPAGNGDVSPQRVLGLSLTDLKRMSDTEWDKALGKS